MAVETWDIVMPEDPRDVTSKSFHRWKSDVLQHTDMAETRLRRLYKLGFSSEDIRADKHHAIYPPPAPVKKRVAPAMRSIRGRTLSADKKAWIYARALHEAAEGILTFYRLEPDRLEETRRDVIRFKELMIKYGHRKQKS